MDNAHALPAEQVLAELHVDATSGLTDDIAERIRQNGRNVLPHAKRRSPARLLLEQFLNIIALLLAVAAAIACGALASLAEVMLQCVVPIAR